VAFAREILKMYEISAAGSVLAGKDLSEALVMVRLVFPALIFLKASGFGSSVLVAALF